MSVNNFIAKQLASPRGFSGKMVSFFMNRQNHTMYEETIRLLALSDSDSVLDIGCGNGYVLNMIARRHGGAFTGVDISKSIIQAAVHRNRAIVNKGNMQFACQNVSDMSFAENSFSRIYTINTVYFWDDLNGVMAEIYRVLKPNGIFVNTLYSNDTLNKFAHTTVRYKKFTEQELTNAGTGAGFSVEIVPILNWAAFCYLYRKIAE